MVQVRKASIKWNRCESAQCVRESGRKLAEFRVPLHPILVLSFTLPAHRPSSKECIIFPTKPKIGTPRPQRNSRPRLDIKLPHLQIEAGPTSALVEALLTVLRRPLRPPAPPHQQSQTQSF